jgi:hypothetical protein
MKTQRVETQRIEELKTQRIDTQRIEDTNV